MDAFRARLRAFLRAVGVVQTKVACALFYYLALSPYALAARACGARFLDKGPDGSASYWKTVPHRDPAESSRRSF